MVRARQLQPGEAAPSAPAGSAARLDALADRARHAAGVAAAQAAVAEGTLPAALSWHPGEVAAWGGVPAVTGVGDLEELLALLEGLVESGDSADEVERALDGVSRLCALALDGRESRIGRLRAQAAGVLAEVGGGMGLVSGEPRRDVCAVVVAWLGGAHPGYGPRVTRTVGAFLSRRAREVARRAARGHARALLAAPTHHGGWIDPRVLAQRLEQTHADRAAPDPADAVGAILRLHPAGGGHAVACLSAMHDEVAQAACYALGGQAGMVGPTGALWAAAAMVRGGAVSDALVARQHPHLSPDVEFLAEVADPAPDPEPPGVAWHGGFADDVYPSLRPSVVGWAATIRPGRLAWLFARGCEALHHWRDATMPGLAAVVAPATDPDVLLDRLGLRMLVLALAAADAECRRLAAEALRGAVLDGRVDAAGLGAALSILLVQRAVGAPRVAPPLAGVAQASPLHAEVVRGAIEAAACGEPAVPPPDLQALLAVLVDLATDAGVGVADPSALSRHAPAAAAAAVHGRVLRAERWLANATS